MRISAVDYEDVRRFPTRFLVRPNHASDDTERIVGERAGFAVVEKVGSDAELAIRSDPRKLNHHPPGLSATDRSAYLEQHLQMDVQLQQPAVTLRDIPDETETIIRHRSPRKDGSDGRA